MGVVENVRAPRIARARPPWCSLCSHCPPARTDEQVNAVGLTEEGVRFVRAAMAKNMPLDISHIDRISQRGVFKLVAMALRSQCQS